jgi:hypothetical protein
VVWGGIRLGKDNDTRLVVPKVRDQLVDGVRVDGVGAATTGYAFSESLCGSGDADGGDGAAESRRGEGKKGDRSHGERSEWTSRKINKETRKIQRETELGHRGKDFYVSGGAMGFIFWLALK